MLLADRPQLGRGSSGSSVGIAPGPLLGLAGRVEHAAGSFGLGEGVRHVRGADGGGELGAAFGQASFCRGQVVPGLQRAGAPPLPVGQTPGLTLPVKRPVELLPVGGDLALAGGGFADGDQSQLGGPLGVRQRLGRRGCVCCFVAWRRDAGGLGDPGQQPGDRDLGREDLVRRGLAATGEPLFHGVEPVGAE